MMSSRVECESESESPRSFFFAFRYDFLASKYFISRQDSRHCKAAAKEQVKLVYLLFFFHSLVLFSCGAAVHIFSLFQGEHSKSKTVGKPRSFCHRIVVIRTWRANTLSSDHSIKWKKMSSQIRLCTNAAVN